LLCHVFCYWIYGVFLKYLDHLDRLDDLDSDIISDWQRQPFWLRAG